MFDQFILYYQEILHFVAELAVHTLELIGITIIAIGSVKAIVQILSRMKKKQHVNVMVDLGRALALALEFKMGAEIVNTVIVRNLEELGILAIVIALRAILALLIHWEIKNEKNLESREEKQENKETKE